MMNFQAAATEQGRRFEDAVEVMFRAAGWTIGQRNAVVAQAEVDWVATDPGGVEWWIECKGSWRGGVPGLRRPDTLKKAIATAWYLSTLPERRPYMLITSHRPMPGTLGERILDAACSHGLFDEVRVVAL